MDEGKGGYDLVGLNETFAKQRLVEKYLYLRRVSQFGLCAIFLLLAVSAFIGFLFRKDLGFDSVADLETCVGYHITNATLVSDSGISCSELQFNELLLIVRSNGVMSLMVLLQFDIPPNVHMSVSQLATAKALRDANLYLWIVELVLGAVSIWTIVFIGWHLKFSNPLFGKPWEQLGEESHWVVAKAVISNLFLIALFVFLFCVILRFETRLYAGLCDVYIGEVDNSLSYARIFILVVGGIFSLGALIFGICISRVQIVTMRDLPADAHYLEDVYAFVMRRAYPRNEENLSWIDKWVVSRQGLEGIRL